MNRRTADGTAAKGGSAQITLAEAILRAGAAFCRRSISRSRRYGVKPCDNYKSLSDLQAIIFGKGLPRLAARVIDGYFQHPRHGCHEWPPIKWLLRRQKGRKALLLRALCRLFCAINWTQSLSANRNTVVASIADYGVSLAWIAQAKRVCQPLQEYQAGCRQSSYFACCRLFQTPVPSIVPCLPHQPVAKALQRRRLQLALGDDQVIGLVARLVIA
jgi:hypothetical protein